MDIRLIRVADGRVMAEVTGVGQGWNGFSIPDAPGSTGTWQYKYQFRAGADHDTLGFVKSTAVTRAATGSLSHK